MVVLDANPLVDIRHSTSIVAVVQFGELIDRQKLTQLRHLQSAIPDQSRQ